MSIHIFSTRKTPIGNDSSFRAQPSDIKITLPHSTLANRSYKWNKPVIGYKNGSRVSMMPITNRICTMSAMAARRQRRRPARAAQQHVTIMRPKCGRHASAQQPTAHFGRPEKKHVGDDCHLILLRHATIVSRSPSRHGNHIRRETRAPRDSRDQHAGFFVRTLPHIANTHRDPRRCTLVEYSHVLCGPIA